MEKQMIRMFLSIGFIVGIVWNPLCVHAEIQSDGISVIEAMVEAENEHNWNEFASLWIDEREEELINLPADTGVKTVNSADLICLYPVNEADIPGYTLDSETAQDYTDIQYYLAGIKYTTNQASKFFYNGTNFRLITLGLINDTWKVISRQDAPWELMCAYADETENISALSENSDNEEITESIYNALAVRTARTEGLIVDGNLDIIDVISDVENGNGLIGENYSEYTISPNGFRPNMSSGMTCPHKKTSTVIIKDVGSKSIGYYTRNVLPEEWYISTSPAAALEFGVVQIIQYATWNVLFYQKYPDFGYDVRAGTGDQAFAAGSYSELTSAQQAKVDNAWNAVNGKHVETSNSNFFEAFYGSNAQNRSVELANQNKNYQYILHDHYDGKTANHDNIYIGTAKIVNYTSVVAHP